VRVVWVLSAALMTVSVLHTPNPGAGMRPMLTTVFHEVITLFCASTFLIALEGGFPFLRWKALTYTGLIALSVVSFVVVYVIAALSWEWFEKRFVRWGHRWRYQGEKGAALVAPEGATKLGS
jgi:peptidoglycan/LPS O-acetylase OafA/YrhL